MRSSLNFVWIGLATVPAESATVRIVSECRRSPRRGAIWRRRAWTGFLRAGALNPRTMTWLSWALLSALFAALTAVWAKIGLAEVNSHLATAWRTTVVLVFVWIIALASNRPDALFSLSRRSWVFLALSGVATGISWLCYFRALQLGEASRVAPIDKLSVVLVILFAALFLGEPLTWKTAIGAGLICAGAAILAVK